MPFMSNSITPIKLGVKFDPPSVVLYYRDKSKLRSRQVPCRDVDILTDVTLYVDKFKVNPKNKTYFEKVSNKRIENIRKAVSKRNWIKKLKVKNRPKMEIITLSIYR